MAKKRITELATETTLKDGQFVAIDHSTDGTKKYDIGSELTDLKEGLTLETEARENLGSTLASLGLVVVNGQLCAKYAE